MMIFLRDSQVYALYESLLQKVRSSYSLTFEVPAPPILFGYVVSRGPVWHLLIDRLMEEIQHPTANTLNAS